MEFIKYIYIFLLGLSFSQIHFIVDIPGTGKNEILIIENVIGLELGDEIGVFDSEGLITPNGEPSCDSIEDELLVGAGVYNGEQLEIVGIGSLDYCNLPEGYKLSGWIEDNSVVVKVWDKSEDIEYIPEYHYTNGGYWGNILHHIETLEGNGLSINGIDNFSLINVYPNPFNPYITFNIRDDYQYNINISIYNLLGNKIYNTVYDSKDKNSIIWDASDYDSGIYFVKLYNDNLSLTKRISLIK